MLRKNNRATEEILRKIVKRIVPNKQRGWGKIEIVLELVFGRI